MTKTNKATLATCIMENADKFPHPVLQVDVRDHDVYILTELPEAAGGRGSGECVRYGHNCGDIDFSKLFEKEPNRDITVHLTVPDDDEGLPLLSLH